MSIVGSRMKTPVERLLEQLYDSHAALREGAVATYIPELATVDPGLFGISIVTTDGHEYSIGDSQVPLTIQSISKPFVYGLALEDNGEDYVLERVGLEPSGDAFNAISLDPVSGRPSNPMINAGAIATAAMVQGREGNRLKRVLDMFGRYAGHDLEVDLDVYRSECETGHRNRAIGHLLRNYEIVSSDPDAALDLYFRQCSISVTCRDLALMGACLANAGVNPVSGMRAVDSRFVENILSVMGSCGMYDYAGEWIYRVGMPAKSGVAGGVVAVLPGQFGIGVFSPLLDPRGNSVRGVRVCADLSDAYGLHMLNVPNLGSSAVRAAYDATAVRSKRKRQPRAAEALLAGGSRIGVYELQGDLVFSSVEVFSRQVVAACDAFEIVCIDFKHAGRIGEGALAMLIDLIGSVLEAGKLVALSGVGQAVELAGRAEEIAGAEAALAVFRDKDLAPEWCEERLLLRLATELEDGCVPFTDNELCHGLNPSAARTLEAAARPLHFATGETIVRRGEDGQSVYLLTRGEVSVTVDLPGGGSTRVATLGPGMTFGEMAMLGESVRSANVQADSDVECWEVTMTDLVRLGESDPHLRSIMYENLARKLASNLRSANAEVRALSG